MHACGYMYDSDNVDHVHHVHQRSQLCRDGGGGNVGVMKVKPNKIQNNVYI